MLPVDRYITDEGISGIREAINESGGREVLLVGYSDETGIVEMLSPGDVVIHNHPSGQMDPSDEDLEVASQLGNLGIGCYIVDNEVSSIYVIVERHNPQEIKSLDSKKLENLLLEGGEVSKKLPGYEYRAGQISMLREIIECFNNEKIGVIEAGTGIGKTMAYLIPAVSWSLANNKRCVISTRTINLQEQIVKKDIPFLQSVFKEDFKAVLVKGRNNYICLRKVEAENRELPELVLDEKTLELKTLIKWARMTEDGSLSELNFVPMSDIWDRLKCEGDDCTRTKCAYYEKCFLVKARRDAAVSQILIVNHHLLFADLALRSEMGSFGDIAVLPPYKCIILDEAHHIEEAATDFFGIHITRWGIIRLLGHLYSVTNDGQTKGLLSRLRSKLIPKNKGAQRTKISSLIENIEKKIIHQRYLIADDAQILFDETIDFIKSNMKEKNDNSAALRFTPQITDSDRWINQIIPKADKVVGELRRFKNALRSFRRSFKDLSSEILIECEDLLIDLRAQEYRISAYANSLDHIIHNTEKEYVKWGSVQPGRAGYRINLHSSPLSVGENLQKSLFDQFPVVILTSATLTIHNEFSYLNNRIGLAQFEKDRLLESVFPSPFLYNKQVMIGIPLDLPDPNEPHFLETASRLIFRSLCLSRGRAFVLFTSYRMLNDIYNNVNENSDNLTFSLLKQGEQSRTALLNQFRKIPSSVLFGTDSFWEGVDVVGSSLESVIIVRLPFRVPTEPVIEARLEAIEMNGGNPFYEFTVPQAVIKFRQGFGRLIRTKKDCGFILILDKRVIKKAYGKIFLHSLPECRVAIGNQDQVFSQLKEFYINDARNKLI